MPLPRLAKRRRQPDHHVAEQRAPVTVMLSPSINEKESTSVRRGLVAPLAIERCDRLVVHQGDRKLRASVADRLQHATGASAQQRQVQAGSGSAGRRTGDRDAHSPLPNSAASGPEGSFPVASPALDSPLDVAFDALFESARS